MKFIKLNQQDSEMMIAFLSVYQNYEAEISNEELEDIFPRDKFEKNYEHFVEYFEGKITYICIIDGEYRGFVTFHIDSKEVPGYVEGYEGWGHLSEVYANKQSRKLGLGSVMVNLAEEELQKLGAKRVYLNDIVGNDHFWKALGYTDTGIIEPDEGGRIYIKNFDSK